jgi:alkylation response protein AidB-like acyl-CoA dehydrogenase
VFDHLGIEEIANEEYQLVRAMAKQIVENDIFPVRQYFDDDHDHSKYIEPLFNKILLRYGVQPILVSKRAPSLVSNCGFNEEIARGDSGIAVALACTSWAVFPLQHEPYKREDLLKELTAVFREDKIHFGCFAMTEPEGGCDIENLRIKGKTIRTTARLEGNEWVIRTY